MCAPTSQLSGCSKTPAATIRFLDAVPQLEDLLRRIVREDTYAGVIELQGVAARFLAQFDDSEILGHDPAPKARPFVAGPRSAVYLVVPGARVTSTGQLLLVFDAISRGGSLGKSSAELRKELQLRPKSLESVLYRLRLAKVIRGYDVRDIRGDSGSNVSR